MVEMMNYIATLTIILVPTVGRLLRYGQPLRLTKLPHRSPMNYFCISESSMCVACNNNKDLNCVSWEDSPILPCVEKALSNHATKVLTNNNQPPLLTIPVLTQWACGQMSTAALTGIILESTASLPLGRPSFFHPSVQKQQPTLRLLTAPSIPRKDQPALVSENELHSFWWGRNLSLLEMIPILDLILLYPSLMLTSSVNLPDTLCTGLVSQTNEQLLLQWDSSVQGGLWDLLLYNEPSCPKASTAVLCLVASVGPDSLHPHGL